MLVAVKLEKEMGRGGYIHGGRNWNAGVNRDRGFDLIGNNKLRICCTFLHVFVIHLLLETNHVYHYNSQVFSIATRYLFTSQI